MRKRETLRSCHLKVGKEILTVLRLTGEERLWGIARFGKVYTII